MSLIKKISLLVLSLVALFSIILISLVNFTVIPQVSLAQNISSLQNVVTPGFSFRMDLQLGNTDSDITQLQKVLNADVETVVAVSGAGSRGYETTYFGSATKAAVIKFQTKYSSVIPIADGLVNKVTRAKLNLLIGVLATSDSVGSPHGRASSVNAVFATTHPITPATTASVAPITIASTTGQTLSSCQYVDFLVGINVITTADANKARAFFSCGAVKNYNITTPVVVNTPNVSSGLQESLDGTSFVGKITKVEACDAFESNLQNRYSLITVSSCGGSQVVETLQNGTTTFISYKPTVFLYDSTYGLELPTLGKIIMGSANGDSINRADASNICWGNYYTSGTNSNNKRDSILMLDYELGDDDGECSNSNFNSTPTSTVGISLASLYSTSTKPVGMDDQVWADQQFTRIAAEKNILFAKLRQNGVPESEIKILEGKINVAIHNRYVLDGRGSQSPFYLKGFVGDGYIDDLQNGGGHTILFDSVGTVGNYEYTTFGKSGQIVDQTKYTQTELTQMINDGTIVFSSRRFIDNGAPTDLGTFGTLGYREGVKSNLEVGAGIAQVALFIWGVPYFPILGHIGNEVLRTGVQMIVHDNSSY